MREKYIILSVGGGGAPTPPCAYSRSNLISSIVVLIKLRTAVARRTFSTSVGFLRLFLFCLFIVFTSLVRLYYSTCEITSQYFFQKKLAFLQVFLKKTCILSSDVILCIQGGFLRCNDFKNRLNEALTIRQMSAAELSRRSGIDEGTLSNYKKGKYEPKQRKLEAISRALDVSIAWLMGADVPMRENTTSLRLVSPTVTEDIVSFPVIGEIAAGYNSIANEDWCGDTVNIPVSFLKGREASDFFVLSVKGDSMYPLYQAGDKVLILKQDYIENSGDIGAVMYDGECATLKKIEILKEAVRLVSINPEYQPKEIKGNELEQYHVLGVPRLLIREIG